MTNFTELSTAWQHLYTLAPEAFEPIQDEEALKRATAFLKSLDVEIGERRGHPLASLADAVMHQVMAYEEEHYPIPDADPAGMLAFYLEQRQVKQEEVAAGTGITQSVLSRLLNRKRPFTADHARSLGAFFKTDPSVFL